MFFFNIPILVGQFWVFFKGGRVGSLQKNVFLGVKKVKIELPTLRVLQKFPPAAGYIIVEASDPNKFGDTWSFGL